MNPLSDQQKLRTAHAALENQKIQMTKRLRGLSEELDLLEKQVDELARQKFRACERGETDSQASSTSINTLLQG